MPALFKYSMPHRIVNTEALLRYGPKHGLCFDLCFGTKAVLRSVLRSMLRFRVRVHVRVRVSQTTVPAHFSYSMQGASYGQYCVACERLSSVVVCNKHCRRAGRSVARCVVARPPSGRVRGRSGS